MICTIPRSTILILWGLTKWEIDSLQEAGHRDGLVRRLIEGNVLHSIEVCCKGDILASGVEVGLEANLEDAAITNSAVTTPVWSKVSARAAVGRGERDVGNELETALAELASNLAEIGVRVYG